MDKKTKIDEAVKRLTDKLTDEGKIIEAGWLIYRHQVLPPDVSPVQQRETRKAFFAGCQHLFASMNTFLDEGDEPTERDLRRMDNIDAELREFVEELKRSLS